MNKKKIVLTLQQLRVLEKFKDFIRDKNKRAFILKGYAGTGKTTITKELINELSRQNIPYKLLASTGRAAKILRDATEKDTHTIHGLIYSFNGLNKNVEDIINERKGGIDNSGQLALNFSCETVETKEEYYYLIDESSMVSDVEDKVPSQAIYGSGRLLRDLLDYNKKGKFIFIGDSCQLPPPTQNLSPALSPAYLKYTFNIEADEVELTEVLRQQKGNDIVHSAQKLRQLCNNPHPAKWAKFPLRGYNNIHLVNTSIDLIDLYLKRVKEVGYNNATFIAGTNAQCNKLAQILRPSFGITSSNLAVGDLLLVTQNNYITSMMNGDLVIITDIGTIERRAGLTFQHVSYEEIITKKTYSQWLISDILNSNTTNLTPQQHKELLIDYTERMKRIGIKQKDPLYNEKMMKDPYLNALRAVYGYALTTHKAQGGEWDYVYLDIPKSMSARDFAYQWVYTAMTRARKELFIVDDWWII